MKGQVVLLSICLIVAFICVFVESGPSRNVRYSHHLMSFKERLNTKINLDDVGAKKLYMKLNKAFPNKERGLFPADTPTFDCDVCIFTIQQIQILFSQNATIDAAEELFADVCVLLGIEGRVVCSGLAHEFGPEIQEIGLADPDLQPEYICQHFLICPASSHQPKPIPQNQPEVEQLTQEKLSSPPSAPNNTRFFIHMSDIHHDPLYQAGTNTHCGLPLCCRASDGPGTAQKWGEYNCDANVPLLNSLESFINNNATFNSRFGNKIDFMIWTGDNPPHDIWAESRGSQLNASKTVSDWLYQSFTVKRKWQIFPSIGNHESFPVDQFPGTPRNSWLMDPTAQYWSRWLGASQLNTVRKGAYYLMQIPGTQHYILSINTMYCDINNFWLVLNDTDPSGQIQWMKNELEVVRRNGGSVYVLGHIPLRDSGCLYNYSSRIGDLIREYSSNGVIKGSFFGHTHDDDFYLFKQGSWNGSKPISVSWIAPSVTPFTYLNPSFRVFEYDPSTFEIVDYHQYNADLRQANQIGYPDWKLYYSAKSAYGLKNMSPEEWERLIGVFGTNDSLFQDWFKRHYSGYYGTGPCTGECKSTTLCAFQASTFKEVFECTGQEYSLGNLWPYIVNHIV
eukprot:TRINITY_DN93_c0_g1_i1.p1 TRINITY_DN93_c0_g1~~TRINITY_DN93_c0_g1_i1.p1  ORF type:complete len:621 (-),score=100.37 TRINITY_DN93_c0_g1_i1:43-1905(-)